MICNSQFSWSLAETITLVLALAYNELSQLDEKLDHVETAVVAIRYRNLLFNFNLITNCKLKLTSFHQEIA